MDPKEFETLAKKFFLLAKTRLGFPTSFLSTDAKFVNNEPLGIKPDSLSSILINEVGDPFKASETWAIEVKNYEVKIVQTLAKYLGMPVNTARGYITSGGTEGNEACIRWAKKYLAKQYSQQLERADKLQQLYLNKIQQSSASKAIVSWHAKRNKQLHIMQQITKPTLIFSAENTHYSIYKIADALDLNILAVSSDINGSVDLLDFKAKVDQHAKKTPFNPLIIIANIGTTLLGAVDNVPQMRTILDSCEFKPKYTIHMDGAMLGILLPILQPFGAMGNYLAYADSLSLSFHKYLGVSQPSGMALTTEKFIDPSLIEYAGNISDITVSGSRSGLNVMLVYNVIFYALELDQANRKLLDLVKNDLAKAQWCYQQLVAVFGADQVFYNPNQFNIVIPKPSQAIIIKYQLMVAGDRAVICVLSNVTKELVYAFINDLVAFYKEEKTMTMKTTESGWWNGDWNNSGWTKGVWNGEDVITILEDRHVTEAIELFADSFCKHEPLVKYLQITKEEFWPLAVAIMQKAAADGLSVVSLDQWGKVTGCAIAENFNAPVQLQPTPKLQPIFALLEQLAAPINSMHLVSNTVVHIWITAVSDTVQGKGLSTRLNNACVLRALEKQFKYIYCEFTNSINERIMQYYPEHLKLNSIKLKDFVWNNTKPFADLDGGVNAYITTVAPFIRLSQLGEVVVSKPWQNTPNWQTPSDWQTQGEWKNQGEWKKPGDWQTQGQWQNQPGWQNQGDWKKPGDWQNQPGWQNQGNWQNQPGWQNQGEWKKSEGGKDWK